MKQDQVMIRSGPALNYGDLVTTIWQLATATHLRVGAHGGHDALLDEELLLGAHLVPPQPDRLLQQAQAEVPEMSSQN